jgi:hypothetical protein
MAALLVDVLVARSPAVSGLEGVPDHLKVRRADADAE